MKKSQSKKSKKKQPKSKAATCSVCEKAEGRSGLVWCPEEKVEMTLDVAKTNKLCEN